MARTKSTETKAAETAAAEIASGTEAEETGAGESRTETENDAADTGVSAAGSPDRGNDTLTLVYIGPSLPFGNLRTSMILKGTGEEIDVWMSGLKESYPEIERLLVTPEELTDALDKVGRKGTILHKYYEDVLAKSRASRK